MKQVLVKGKLRTEEGKAAAKKARARGQVPAVLYGRGKDVVLLHLDGREFARALQAGLASGRFVDLAVMEDGMEDGKETAKTVLLKEIQRDSVTGTVLHVDFQEISMTEGITTTVPVVLVGEDKRPSDGGVLEHVLWKVELHGLPTALPVRVEVPVSGLRIGDSVKVDDLDLPEGVRAVTHGEETVVTVTLLSKRGEEEKPEVAEGGAAETEGKEA